AALLGQITRVQAAPGHLHDGVCPALSGRPLIIFGLLLHQALEHGLQSGAALRPPHEAGFVGTPVWGRARLPAGSCPSRSATAAASGGGAVLVLPPGPLPGRPGNASAARA